MQSVNASDLTRAIVGTRAERLALQSSQITEFAVFCESDTGNIYRYVDGWQDYLIGYVNTEGTKKTYSASVVGFTPAATATDFFAITGSATKTVRVTHLQISGVATSGVAVDVVVLKRSTANTGGTPSAVTAVPNDSANGAATASVVTYGANPTTGTLVGNVRSAKVGIGTSTSVNITEQPWQFGIFNGQAIVLRGVNEVLAMNWNGAAVGAGMSLDIDIEWTEE